MKTIKKIFKDIEIQNQRGDMDLEISSLEYDSRSVGPGTLFFALEGVHTDGHKYIDQAIHQGASGVVYSHDLDFFSEGVCYLKVKNTRQALSPASAAFYDYPSKKLKVIGVTGTDGKSTTVSFIHQLLVMEGRKSGFLSTVNYQVGRTIQANPYRQSTPEAPHIHKILREMVDNGLEYAVLEATSHGLSVKNSRLADVDFDVAVLTNVTHEHLEFHGTVEQYRLDKANLFKKIAVSSSEETFGVVNDDDQWSEIYMDAVGEKPVFLYSLKNKDADLWCSDYKSDERGIALTFNLPNGKKKSRLNMPGLFNVENAMAALLVVSEILEEDALELLENVPKLVGVEGRMTPINGTMPFSVLVDYAHTPGSFEKILPLVKSDVQGKLIVLFGSAGERDIEKRSEQGEIADDYADIIILSDEDPRGDDPMDILKDIAEGITSKDPDKNLFLIPDRREGMKKAIELASEGDMILTLGKGHESSIIYEDGPHPWKEADVLKSLLKEAGYTIE
ncbi:UDP-N-acetylmuramoyl-L-alanyl-D-glutamate--2,6-diaminopimelate ligase [Oceanispirochaeta crateris]|uniref:UDP-N-acetylmuramyl-tripeptide synthetase n=1 Tax=Oceanispirochaeta crateris TaxID=2518645 RepID=A0A5C1QKJ0_9SPIO|nr:UDP-N-acetylmuramoyl-L-alanyl-D-glutamate--2,6-diaminopimelate ligase [Oceanispirochaeta crateris]QEN07036.1 UDP-N-acetylmuramoyl-L-alanyl-D-glutamate--2,6-diaminopimelate ligase [Oceanispirochaeta crateris]